MNNSCSDHRIDVAVTNAIFAPQIAFTLDKTRAIRGPHESLSGLSAIAPMPATNVPVVDLSDANQSELQKILLKYLGAEGVLIPLDEFIAKLVAVGCKVKTNFNLETQEVESKIKQLSLELT